MARKHLAALNRIVRAALSSPVGPTPNHTHSLFVEPLERRVLLSALLGETDADVWWMAFETCTEAACSSTGFRVVDEAAGGIILSLDVPGLEINRVTLEGNGYDQLSVPGGGISGEIGSPALPFVGGFVEIPYGVQVGVRTVAETTVDVVGDFNVIPVQPAAAEGEAAPEFVINEDAYEANAFMGTEEAVTVVESGVIRGHNVVFVSASPVRYNPSTGDLRITTDLTVELVFEGEVDAQAEARADALSSGAFETIASEMILNYSPPAGEETAKEGLSPGEAADYLIIAGDDFYDELLPLAQWKHMKGFKTKLVTMSQIGATASDVANYIQNAYDNWTVAPTYVLLVGDHDIVPTNDMGDYVSDHPYACVDGSDYFPDLTIGRLTAADETEAGDIVAKILAYDRTPAGGSWYDDALITAFFQDYNDYDRYADRWFMETAVHVGDFLEDEQGYTIYSALCAETVGSAPYSGTYYYRTLSYPHRPSHTAEAPTEVVALWTSESQASTDIATAINAGVGIVQHRDHGGASGWSHPPFYSANVNALSNGVMTPVVFSLNCSTGAFDYTGGDCFAEAFLEHPDGGAVGIVAATRTSYSGFNDLITHGIYTCFWPEYDPTHTDSTYPNSMRPAEALNYGKYYMYTYEGPGSYTEIEFNEFHWFGDPEMMLRTDSPHSLDVSHPITVQWSVPTDVTVTVQDGGQPVGGALVCISKGDSTDYWTGLTDEFGEAVFPGLMTNEMGDYDLVVSAFNAHPCESTITALPAGPYGLLEDPAKGSAVNVDQGYVVIQWQDASGSGVDESTIDADDITIDGVVIGAPLELGGGFWRYSYTGSLVEGLVEVDYVTGEVENNIGESNIARTESFVYDLSGPAGALSSPGAFEIVSKDRGYVDVAWSDVGLAGVNEATLDAGDITITGVSVDGAPTCRGSGVWRYAYTGTLAEGVVTVSYVAGEVFDAAGNSNAGGSDSFFLKAPETIYSADMDTDPGWTLDPGTEPFQWEWGAPTGGGSYNGDPTSAYTGDNVIGYNLDGDYADDTDPAQYATTPAIDCSDYKDVTLSFYQWLAVESSSYDHASVDVSTWHTVWQHAGGDASPTEWSHVEYDISEFADGESSVYVRWGMGPTDDSATYPGWNIDDVLISGAQTQMRVAGSDPEEGEILFALPVDFAMDFTYGYDADSIDASDLSVNGTPADTFSLTDADTVTFHYAVSPVVAEGLQDMAIAAAAIEREWDGAPILPWSAQFRYDALQMQLDSTVPPDGTVVETPFTDLIFNFNEPYDPGSVDAGDLYTSMGSVDGVSVIDADTIQFLLSDVDTEGVMIIGVPAGAITDAFGNPIAAYAGSFTVDYGTAEYPTPLEAKAPTGSLIYDPVVAASVYSATDVDSYTIQVDADQTITVVVVPDALLQPVVELSGPGGLPMGGASAPGPGLGAVLQTAEVTDQGTHTVSVSGAGGTTGQYEVRVFLNAAVEAEEHDGPANDDLASAQDLAPSFVELATGVTRGAVLGHLPQMPDLPVITEDFESGVFSPAWSTYSSDPQGRIRLSDAYGTAGGDYALLMDRNPGGDATLNEAIWTVDLSGLAQPTLFVQLAEWADEPDNFAGPFTDHYSADGIAISGDGINWYPVLGPQDQPSGIWEEYAVDLAAGAAAAGITLGVDFRIKLQQYDDLPLTSDGRGWDELAIAVPMSAEDWYSFELSAGDRLTAAATAYGPGCVAVELYDGAGSLVTAGVKGNNNVDSVIDGLVVATDGTYYARVLGQYTDYSLVVNRNAAFDREANDSLAEAQEITISAAALGALTSGDGDWYAFNAEVGDALSLFTLTPGDGAGQFDNGLDPRLDLYDPLGSLVASDDDGAGDGRNALIDYDVSVPGQYVACVDAEAGEGEYLLQVDGATGADPAPLVVQVNPPPASLLAYLPTTLTVEFSEAILAQSVQDSDLLIDNGGVVTGHHLSAGNVIVFDLSLPGDGVYNVWMNPDAVDDLQGNGLLCGFASDFSTDTAGPTVLCVTPDGTVASEPMQIVIEFSESLNEGTATDAANYALTASGGDAVFGNANDVDLAALFQTIAYDDNAGAGPYAVTIGLTSPLPDERYRLTIEGTNSIRDLHGNRLNDGLDEVRYFAVDAVAPTVDVDLQAASDTGVSDSDNITSDNTPTFSLTVNEAGRVEVDYTNDGSAERTFLFAQAGTLSFTPMAGAGAFQPISNYLVTQKPSGAFSADFNGDCCADFATANYGDPLVILGNTISVRLGNGDGSFQGQQINYVSAGPLRITGADFNNDGNVDLAASNYGDPLGAIGNTLSLLFGNGDGSFQSCQTVYVGDGPSGLLAEDVDSDGNADLVATLYGNPQLGVDNRIAVLMGNGDGTFQAVQHFTVGDGPVCSWADDFNGDAVADLAVANAGDPDDIIGQTVSVLIGNGDGTFQTQQTFDVQPGPSHVTGADFNGDGNADLALACRGNPSGTLGETVSILLGNGDGSFQGETLWDVELAPTCAVSGQFNSDSFPDLAVTNYDSVSILYGYGDGTFSAPQNHTVRNGPTSLHSSDFDCNGAPDLVVANSLDPLASVLLADSAPLDDGDYAFRATFVDATDNPTEDADPTTIDTAPPAVDFVWIGSDSASWALGQVRLDEQIIADFDGIIPWSRVNTIGLQFTEDAYLQASPLSYTAALHESTLDPGAAAQPTQDQAVWTWSDPDGALGGYLDVNWIKIRLDGDAVSDTAGNVAGQDSLFSIKILPGDADGDGKALSADRLEQLANLGRMIGQPEYLPRTDTDADGRVLSSDRLTLLNRLGSILPAEPSEPPEGAGALLAVRIDAPAEHNPAPAAGLLKDIWLEAHLPRRDFGAPFAAWRNAAEIIRAASAKLARLRPASNSFAAPLLFETPSGSIGTSPARRSALHDPSDPL